MSLLQTLRAITTELDRAGIPHMVAGSVASTYYSDPRTTQDIDIVIDPTRESLGRFVSSLVPDRYYVGDATTALAERSQFNVIDVTSGWKVDLIICRDRPFSRSELARRRKADIEGVSVYIATPEDTILAKLEWANLGESQRQVADAEAIVRAVGDELDLAYLRHWAPELGVSQVLESVLRPGGDD